MKIVSKRHAAAHKQEVPPFVTQVSVWVDEGGVTQRKTYFADGTTETKPVVTGTVTASPTIAQAFDDWQQAFGAHRSWVDRVIKSGLLLKANPTLTKEQLAAYIRGDHLKALTDARTPGVSAKLPFEQINGGKFGWEGSRDTFRARQAEELKRCGWTLDEYLEERDRRVLGNLPPFQEQA